VRNRNVVIANSHFYNKRGIGVYLDEVNLHQINITNSHISYNSGGGVVSRGGNVRNLQIGSCDIEGNHRSDGPASANIWLDSTGGSVGEVAITGCTVQHTNKSPDSANIRIQGGGMDLSLERREGRASTREGNVTIGNNVFSDVQVNIDIRNARGVIVTGNTFWEGFQRNGVVFRNSADSSFIGNLVSGVRVHAAAVEFSNCERMQISNNSMLDSDGAALRLSNVSRSVIVGNLLRDDRRRLPQSISPVIVEGGTENLIQSNSGSVP
jgi:hypothetical protein